MPVPVGDVFDAKGQRTQVVGVKEDAPQRNRHHNAGIITGAVATVH
jgi:hypothetical protein